MYIYNYVVDIPDRINEIIKM